MQKKEVSSRKFDLEQESESSYLVTRLKCDRGHPCDTCKRRGHAHTCTYVAPNTSSQVRRPKIPQATTSNQLQDRIGQLEQLVTSLANKPDSAQPTSQISTGTEGSTRPGLLLVLDDKSSSLRFTSPSQYSGRAGRINFSRTETTYVESGHWTSILDGVCLISHILHHSDNQDGRMIKASTDLKTKRLLSAF
jgi:hypothetical protein